MKHRDKRLLCLVADFSDFLINDSSFAEVTLGRTPHLLSLVRNLLFLNLMISRLVLKDALPQPLDEGVTFQVHAVQGSHRHSTRIVLIEDLPSIRNDQCATICVVFSCHYSS